jgi:hypothetical protein
MQTCHGQFYVPSNCHCYLYTKSDVEPILAQANSVIDGLPSVPRPANVSLVEEPEDAP